MALLALLRAASVSIANAIVLLTSIYALLWSHKLDLTTEVLNLIWLSLLHVPRDSSFILSQCFDLNEFVDLVYFPTCLLFPMFHYYTIISNIRLSIIFCLSFGGISFFRYFFIILICNLICLNYFVVNFLKVLLFFDIPLLYYFNLSSSIISCLSFGDIYLSLGINWNNDSIIQLQHRWSITDANMVYQHD